MLRAEGYTVHKLTERFESGTPDEEWLPVVGRKGWVLVTKDKRIRRRAGELRAFVNARVVAFAITAGGLSGASQAELFRKALPKILRQIRRIRKDRRGEAYIAHVTARSAVQEIHVSQYLP